MHSGQLPYYAVVICLTTLIKVLLFLVFGYSKCENLKADLFHCFVGSSRYCVDYLATIMFWCNHYCYLLV